MRLHHGSTHYTGRKLNARKDLINPTMPIVEGIYYWSEYGTVEVYKKGRSLYVTPPIRGGIEIKITPRIGGEFTLLSRPGVVDITHADDPRVDEPRKKRRTVSS